MSTRKKVVRDAGMAMIITPQVASEMRGEKMDRFPGGGTSSKAPRLDYIPYQSLVRLANRFALGEERRPDGTAWNALRNYQVTKNKAFLISRCVHAIEHAYLLIAKIDGLLPDNGDDDAAAIMWAGSFLCEATTPGGEKLHDAK